MGPDAKVAKRISTSNAIQSLYINMYDFSYLECCGCGCGGGDAAAAAAPPPPPPTLSRPPLKLEHEQLPQSVQMSPSIISHLLNANYILSESRRTIWRVIRF